MSYTGEPADTHRHARLAAWVILASSWIGSGVAWIVLLGLRVDVHLGVTIAWIVSLVCIACTCAVVLVLVRVAEQLLRAMPPAEAIVARTVLRLATPEPRQSDPNIAAVKNLR